MAGTQNHFAKARRVKETWAARCDGAMFVSSVADARLPVVALNVSEGRGWLWAKTKEAFRLVHRLHLHDYDWFLKADDDTYVVVENLRALLRPHGPDQRLWFGCYVERLQQRFMSGGAGYVLSRAAVGALVEEGLAEGSKCAAGHAGPEDVRLARCLRAIGVRDGDSRDPQGRHRFFPESPEFHLNRQHKDPHIWYAKNIRCPKGQAQRCISPGVISFHHVSPSLMRLLDFLLYDARVTETKGAGPIKSPAAQGSPIRGIPVTTTATTHP